MRAFYVTVLLACGIASSAFATDIDRNGDIQVPSQEEAKAICRKNPYINSNVLLLGCVQQEIASAQNVVRMIRKGREIAGQAYWTCVENPFIDSYALLDGCMMQEAQANEQLY